MSTLILNTCGTSLLTGGNISNQLRSDLRQYANAPTWQAMPPDIAQKLKKHAHEREQELLSADESSVRKLSAELNGLLSWQETHTSHPRDLYLLLSTDTVLGKKTAKSIALWLEKNNYSTNIISADKLNTENLVNFREGLSELAKSLIESLDGYKQNGYQIQFNLTGGFKGLNAFLQALSTIYADQTFYLFESSKELLFIPKLPFTLDKQQTILENMSTFRRLSEGLPVSPNEYQKIPDALLFYIGDEVMLSEWGELFWRASYKTLYERELLPTISERIIYGKNFEESTKGLPAKLIEIINQRITDLAKYAENNCTLSLASLDPKPLQGGQHKKEKRWECDLDNHHRIFMIKDGYSFTLEKVDKALH